MREVQASKAKAHLPRLLSEVERGETIVITRHGRAIARLVPEPVARRSHVHGLKAEIEAFRKSMPALPIEEILAGRRDGHRN